MTATQPAKRRPPTPEEIVKQQKAERKAKAKK
jgi:hypothetical protein